MFNSRRRYWHLAYAGGIFVEALESAEPWKLETRGLTEEDYQELSKEKEGKSQEEEEEVKPPSAKKIKLDEEAVKLEEEDKENKAVITTASSNSTTTTSVSPAKCSETEAALSRLGSDILVTPKTEIKHESRHSPKVTPNGFQLNLLNHSTYFNMSISPMVLNGSVVITPREGANTSNGFGADNKLEKPWFNLVAREEPSSPPPGQEQQQEKGKN